MIAGILAIVIRPSILSSSPWRGSSLKRFPLVWQHEGYLWMEHRASVFRIGPRLFGDNRGPAGPADFLVVWVAPRRL